MKYALINSWLGSCFHNMFAMVMNELKNNNDNNNMS